MKTSTLRHLLPAVFALSCCPLFGAELIKWSFAGAPGNQASSSSTANDANITPTTVTRGSGVTASAATGSISATGWTSATSIDANDYFEFTVDPAPGYLLTLNTISFAERRSATGIRTLTLRSSLDSFAADIVTPIGVPDDTNTRDQVITLPGAFANLPTDTSVVFRIYGYTSEAGTGTWRLANHTTLGGLVVDGTVAVSGTPTVTLSANNSSFGENAGATASTITVTLSAPAAGDTVFTITNPDSTELTVPATVTVLNGATSATFDVAAVPDLLSDGPQNVILTVGTSGYSAGQTTLTVTDTTPVVTLSANNTSFAENATAPASTVTVTLSAPAVGNTEFTITNPDATELTVPATVTVLNGATSATFDVAAVNDLIPDGNQIVTLTVASTIPAYVSDTLDLTVTDVAPTISLSALPPIITETGSSVLTVTLTPVQTSETTVTVTASSGISDLTLANGGVVVVPANTASADIAINGVNDGVFDGNDIVTLTAAATGAQNGTTVVTVTDLQTSPILFSQYYEGSVGNNKYLELKNTSAGSLSLAGHYIVNFGNATAQNWKTLNATGTPATLATKAIAANGSLLIANPDVTLPSYAASGTNYDNGSNGKIGTNATFFNGNDSVVLYFDADANGTLTPAEIVDVIAFVVTANETGAVGQNTSFHRISNAAGFDLAAGTSISDFPTVWAQVTEANVDAATPADPFYLQGAVLPISLSPSVSTFAENAATPASVVTVSVPYNVTANTTVNLAVTVGGSADATEITVPTSVIILSGTNSITFNVAALTDATMDGSQVATITATASGYSNGTTALTVTDIDVPTLTASASVSTIPENTAPPTGADSILTISISPPAPVGGLVVSIINPDPSEIRIPTSFTIPEGSSSFNVGLNSVNDGLIDGDKQVALTLSAPGYPGFTTPNFTVTDVGATTYVSWKNGNFRSSELSNPAISGDDADPDGDGFSNTLEYAFGTNPLTGNSATAFPQSSVTGGVLAMSYRRPVGGASGATYTIQVINGELASGNWGTAVLSTDYTTPAPVANGDGTETVIINFTGVVTGQKFGRILVVVP